MRDIALDYFRELFTATANPIYAPVIDILQLKVTADDNTCLLRPFNLFEFKDAAFNMHIDKSPGVDGLNPIFFQKFWPTIGQPIFDECMKWVAAGSIPTMVNDTIIALIPKCQNLEDMKDLEPISLCNVIYKIFAKVLANRLKVVLPQLISENLSAFVPGKSIINNVLMAFELLHYMKKKVKGKKGDIAIKIDMSKAYDSMDCHFLELVMMKLGFDSAWINLVMMCIRTVHFWLMTTLLVLLLPREVSGKVALSHLIYLSFMLKGCHL